MKNKIISFGTCLRSPAFWFFAFSAEASAILILSVIPSVGSGLNSGLAAHLLAYTTFSCTAGILLVIKKIPRAIVKGALIAALFGCCIELVQYFIPYRACELADAATNCCAALAGMAAAGAVQFTFFKKNRGLRDRGDKETRPLS